MQALVVARDEVLALDLLAEVPPLSGALGQPAVGGADRAALAEGRLSQSRYDSYCAMYEEVKDVKDWQRRGL